MQPRGGWALTIVSPQRLIHYRDNWYLDAWCHERNALRSFSLDAIQNVTLLDEIAKTIVEADLDAELGSGYGIFSGREVEWAELCFSVERARYVGREALHKEQTGEWLPDGRYLLRIPYSDERELIMDILRHGDDVEVLSPASLRSALQRKIAQIHAMYCNTPENQR